MGYVYLLLSGRAKPRVVSVVHDVVSHNDQEAVSNGMLYFKDRTEYLNRNLEIWDLQEDVKVCSISFD